MELIAERLNRLSESATIKMAQMSRELKQQGIDVVDMSLGEPDFDTPQHIKDAGIAAINAGHTRYTPVPGTLELRKAIANKLKRDNGLDYTAEQIVVSTGAKQSLMNVFLTVVNPGDEVIIPAPYWVSYAAMAEMSEAIMVNVFASIDQDFKITPTQLEAAITPKTKLLVFSSPCNPSGSVYTKAELEGLAEVLAKYPQVVVVSDEIYEYINFGGQHESIGQFESIKNQVVVVNGCSKGYAMTGWRIGYIASANNAIVKGCTKIQGQFTSGTCSIAQYAAETALSGDMTPTTQMCERFHQRRDLILELFEEIPGVKTNVPKGAFYIFPDVSAYFGKSYNGDIIADANDLSLYILKEAHVSLVAGSAFGSDNCIRISYATSEDNIREAVKRIKEALGKLR